MSRYWEKEPAEIGLAFAEVMDCTKRPDGSDGNASRDEILTQLQAVK